MHSDQGDEILKSSEFSDRSISFSEVRLFEAFNDYTYFVSYGAVRIVFRLVDPFGGKWIDSQLPWFPGVDSRVHVIESNRCAIFFHCSFPVLMLWTVHGLQVCEWIAVDGR